MGKVACWLSCGPQRRDSGLRGDVLGSGESCKEGIFPEQSSRLRMGVGGQMAACAKAQRDERAWFKVQV